MVYSVFVPLNGGCSLYLGWLFCRVRGFDHSALDACQKGWERHSFPYKLGSYQKRFLSQPQCVAEINYINSSISPPGQEGGGDWMESLTSIPVVKSGRLDCFAIWIDYQLTPTVELNHFDPVTEDFPHYFKLVLRFVATPVVVVGGTSPYMCKCRFVEGDNDFNFDFDPIPPVH